MVASFESQNTGYTSLLSNNIKMKQVQSAEISELVSRFVSEGGKITTTESREYKQRHKPLMFISDGLQRPKWLA
jgi:hypothetical protein